MMFKGTIKTRRNQIIEQIVEAENINDARTQLAKSGTVIKLKKTGGFISKFFTIPLEPSDRQIFMQRLAAMTASKMSASESLKLIETYFKGPISKVAGTMLRNVEQGADIPGAMIKIGSPDFPDTTTALVEAGSRGGNTAQALKDAAIFETEMETIKKGASSGIWSAIMGFIAALATTVGGAFWAGPKIMESDLIKKGGENVDVQWMFDIAEIMGYVMVVLGIIFFGLFMLGSIGRKLIPTKADNIIGKIPYYKDMILSKNNYITLYGLSLLVRSGVAMEEALRLTMNAAQKGKMKDDLERAVENVKSGKPWAEAMDSLHETDKAALAASQDRTQIAESLDAFAYQYRTLYGIRMGTFVPLLQVITALFLTISGGLLFGMTILPMLQVAGGGLG